MGSVKQWPIYTSYGRRRYLGGRDAREGSATGEGALERAAQATGVGEAARLPEAREQAVPVRSRSREVRGVRTTGIFEVPSDTVIQLVVAISSFSGQAHPASVRIRRLDRDELEPVFFRALTVPAGGAERIVVDGLGGQTVEVEVNLPSDLLVPTVTVTQYFPADGGILVLVYKSPGDLVPV